METQGIHEATTWSSSDSLEFSSPDSGSYISGTYPRESTDILLLSGSDGIENLSGLYRIEGEYEISERLSVHGETSIKFEYNGIKLFPTSEAMWTAGREWGDFTLDFWLNPTNLNDGELLFLWKGRTAYGKAQLVRARVENRRLIWDFENFFRLGSIRSLIIQLQSKPLVPGEWRHHRIRYKRDDSDPGPSGASPGLLEYLVDNIPTDSVHTTPIGTESSEVFYPKIGSSSKRPLILGSDFNGYIDEIYLSSTFDTSPIREISLNLNARK